MSKLEELIARLCPDGVEYKELVDCCEILDNKRKPVTKSARVNGIYPYYGANGIQDYVADYIFDGEFVLVGEDGSVVNKDGTPVVTWASGKIWVNNHAHVITGIESVLLRYLYHYLQTVNVSVFIHGNIPKLTGKDFKAIKVPVPPLEVQREIVRILDSFTFLTAELTAKLTAELAARQKQYEFYRDNLLNFSDIQACDTSRSKLLEKLMSEFCPAGVKYNKLDTVCSIYDGTHTTPKYTEQGVKFASVENIADPFKSKKYISMSDYEKYKIKPQLGDILMTRIGSIGVCTVIEQEEPLAYYVSLALLRPDKKVYNSKFLKYAIESLHGRKELRKRTLINAVPIKINKDDIGKIHLPVPPLEVQQRIVDILDRFDALCNDITSGLPAEIEARKKQYEYYRDKLLTFKELKKEA